MPVRSNTKDEGGSPKMLQLESAVLSNAKGQNYFTTLQNWLISQQDDNVTPQKCSVEMMKKVITSIQKELQCMHFQEVGIMVSAIQHVAKFQDFSDGLPVLLSCGLAEILVYAFQVAQTHISKSCQNVKQGSAADLLMETLLETINDISDYSAEGKRLTVMKFTDKLMDLIVDNRKIFKLRMEAQRSLNLLLENCPGNVTQSLTGNNVVKKLMHKMAELLPSYGDFEMQVACTEALARLVTKSKRTTFAAEWFTNDKFASAFLNIRDLNFETDCRRFLNFMNQSCGKERSVYSFPCQEAYLGNYKLLQPPDENLPEFWVDFNTASQSITLYVAEGSGDDEEEAGMWETVTLKSDLVKSYTQAKQGNSQILQLNLTIPAQDILHFCPSQQQVAMISFASSIDISTALATIIGQEKYEPPQMQKKASVSKVNVRVNRNDLSSIGLVNGHTVKADVHQSEKNSESQESHGSLTSNRPKVSVPIQPLRVPTLISYKSSPSVSSSHSGYATSGSKGTANSHHPKTPTRPSSSATKKVKTPLQIRVADKQPVASTTVNHAQPKPTRKISMSSTSAHISINTSGAKEARVDRAVGTPVPRKNNVNKADPLQEAVKEAVRHNQTQSGNKNRSIKDVIELKKNSPLKSKENTGQLGKDKAASSDEENDHQTGTKSKKGKTKTAKKKQPAQNSEEKKEIGSARKSGKFKLYSTNNEMLLPDSQESGKRRSKRIQNSQEEKEPATEEAMEIEDDVNKSQKSMKKGRYKIEKTNSTPDSSQEDFVIPSSVPGTQVDSNVQQYLPPMPEEDINLDNRKMAHYRSMNSSICHSPSLSTITEESTQSRKTSSTTGKTPDLQREVHDSLSTKAGVKTKSSKTNDEKAPTKKISNEVPSPSANHSVIEPKKKMKEKKEQPKSTIHSSDVAACRNDSQEFDAVPESQLSPENLIKEPCDKATKKVSSKSTKKQPKAVKKNHKPLKAGHEMRDPFQFTDTDSVTSLNFQRKKDPKDPYKFSDTDSMLSRKSNDIKDKKSAGSKTTGKRQTRGSSQLSTQAFSPELDQESPYQSQNDFRSPMEISGGKKNTNGTTTGKGKKTVAKNKKSKPEAKGKKNKKDQATNNDSLSDVEIMRDASCSKSAVGDMYGAKDSDNEDIYQSDELYKLSDIAAKLKQNKEELDKFLGKSTDKSYDDVEKRSSTKENKSSKKNGGKDSHIEDDKDKPSARMKSFKQKTKPADLIKKAPFDPTFMKFPTRTGPIPTPEDLEEKMKEMKKQKKKEASQKKPFQWDEDDTTEECGVETEIRQEITKGKSKDQTKPSTGTIDYESDSEDAYQYCFDSEEEGIPSQNDNKNTSNPTQKSKGTKKTDGKEKANNKDTDDEDDEVVVRNKNTVKSAQRSKATKKTDGRKEKTNIKDTDDENDEVVVRNKNTVKSAQRSKATKKTDGRKEKANIKDTDDENDELIAQKPAQKSKAIKKVDRKKTRTKDFDDENDEVIAHTTKSTQRNKATKKADAKKLTNTEDNDDESITHNINKKPAQRGKAKKDTVNNNVDTESEVDDVSGHEEMSEIDDVVIESPKSKKSKQSQRKKKGNPQQDWSDADEEQWDDELRDSESTDDQEGNQMKRNGCKRQQKLNQNNSNRSRSSKFTQRLMEEFDQDEEEKNQKKKTQRTKEKQPSYESPRVSIYNLKKAAQQLAEMVSDSDCQRDDESPSTENRYSVDKKLREVKRKRQNKEIEDEKSNDSIKPQKKKARVEASNKKLEKKNRSLSEHSDTSDDEYLQDDVISDEEVPVQAKGTKKQRKPSLGKAGPQAKSKQTDDKPSRNKKANNKNSSRMFGSQIMDAESDEAVDEHPASEHEDQEFDRETVTSVESFHSLCKKLLKHSGDGIAASRARRRISKVDYKEPDESDISLSGSSVSSAPSVARCPSSVSSAPSVARSVSSAPSVAKSNSRHEVKNTKTKMPESSDDGTSPCADDAQSVISNRSWLIEKPKQKVSTYSKTRTEQWIGIGPPVNLDTISAKKKPAKARTGGAAKQKAPPVLPKKPKRSQMLSDDEEDTTYIYYYTENEDVHPADKKKKKQNKKKVTKSATKITRQEEQVDDEEIDDMEVMRSQQFKHNTTPISSALLDYNTGGDDIELYPLTPASVLQDEEIQISQSSIAITPRRDRSPSSIRTPKSVTFEDEEYLQVEHVVEEIAFMSGPVKGLKPSKSSLKRKYPDISDESDDEETGSEDIGSDKQEEDVTLSQVQGMLKPKNLFRTNFASALQTKRKSLVLDDEDYDDDHIAVGDETASSSDGMSSYASSKYNSDGSVLQVTQMMKIIGENIKEKIRRKQTNAQQLTESTIKTAQKQVSRLWTGQHKARRKTQEDFQEKLLTEIVGLEADLTEMETSLQKSQAILQQHQRKVATTLMANVKKIHKLEVDYRTEGDKLEVELGQHMVRNVKGLLRQGLTDMQKKMVQDVQHHEIQTMKRSLQSFLQ